MQQPTSLYMFAIMPPPELAARIQDERLNFAEEYRSVEALKPPVHITLYRPFRLAQVEASTFEKEIKKMQVWANRQHSFEIEVKDFNFFENNRRPVIYIDVVISAALKELHSSFLLELKRYTEIERSKDPYRPHFTIGYRDIDLKVFPAIREAYSKRWFRGSFSCKAIYLWKHNGKNWEVLQEFPLKGIVEQQSLF